MHINEKGQVTIPKAIRERFGFLPHTEIDFQEIDSKVILIKKEHSNNRGINVIKALRAKGDVSVTTDEIMKYTRSY